MPLYCSNFSPAAVVRTAPLRIYWQRYIIVDMPRSQRLIVVSSALLLGLALGFFLSGILTVAVTEPVSDTTGTLGVPLSVHEREFKVAMETVMRIEKGEHEGGYTPELLLAAFPGLKPEDFSGVAAVIGHYQYANGEVTYSNTAVVDGAAWDISDEGIRTLRNNIYRRLNLDQARDAVTVIQLLRAKSVVPTPTPPLAPSDDAGTGCTEDAKLCADGSTVVRSAPNCEFAACPNDDAPPKSSVACRPEQRLVDMCTEQYQPVCASYQIQCVTTPCNPVPKTYPNSCFACMDNNVLSYTEGECRAE